MCRDDMNHLNFNKVWISEFHEFCVILKFCDVHVFYEGEAINRPLALSEDLLRKISNNSHIIYLPYP